MNRKLSMMKNLAIAAALVGGFSGIARAEQQYQVTNRSGESERHFIASETSEEPTHSSQNQPQSDVLAQSDEARSVTTTQN